MPACARPGLRGLQGRPTFAKTVAVVEAMKGERWETFRDRHRDWGRDLVLYLGPKACGLNLGELGEWAGAIDYATVSAAVKRCRGSRVRCGSRKPRRPHSMPGACFT